MKNTLSLFLLALALASSPSASAEQLPFAYDQLDPAVRQCGTASDCTVVMLQCCACTLAAVNAGEAQAVRAEVREALSCGPEVCPISCEGPELRCEAQLCAIDETFTGSDEPGED